MSLAALTKGIDDAYYSEVRNSARDSLGRALDAPRAFRLKAEAEGVGPDTKESEKLYSRWKQYFGVQEWETKRARKIEQFAHDYWTIEKVLADQGVMIDDPEGPTVAKAFEMSSLQVIFPIYYDTIIMSAIMAEPLIDRLVMETVPVNSHTADHAAMNETVTDRTFGKTGELAVGIEVNVSATNNPIKLSKIQGILNTSDEALRLQRIPVFQQGVYRIGRQYVINLTSWAIDTIINGDGTNIGVALTPVACGAANAPVYADYLNLYYNFPIGYQPTEIIASKSVLKRMQNIAEFKDPWAFNMGNVFQASGRLSTPFGLTPHRWDDTSSSTWNNGTTTNLDWLLMVQSERALIMYTEGGLMTETEREARPGQTRIVTSSWVGFGVFDRNAAQVGSSF
jgi:hypothetical protein